MPFISYDSGTAYDFFISLNVLHRPANFGLRPAWAAGVRSRLPAEHRAVLEQAQSFLPVPLDWIYSLPAGQKSARRALAALEALDSRDRIAAMSLSGDVSPDAAARLAEIRRLGLWSEADLEMMRSSFRFGGLPIPVGMAESLCTAWANAETFTLHYLNALKSYYQCFFAEEEERIGPALQKALANAQELAKHQTLPHLLETLSNGVRFDSFLELPEVILAPSYWASPLVFYARLNANRMLLMFGARPEAEPLTPGDLVSPGLVNGLKALADPTRLRILQTLSDQPMAPGDLARRLRLRPPTIIHHLTTLRLAGLVQVILQPEGERRYALRREALAELNQDLVSFLG